MIKLRAAFLGTAFLGMIAASAMANIGLTVRPDGVIPPVPSPSPAPDLKFPNLLNQTPNEVWISADRTDSSGTAYKGKGTQLDPYDGHTKALFEQILADQPAGNLTIHLGPTTPGHEFIVSKHDTVTTNLKSGWTIAGAGMYATEVRLDPTTVVGSGASINLFSSGYNAHTDGVTLRDMTLNCNWPAIAAAATANLGSNTVTCKIVSGSSVLQCGADGTGGVVTANAGVGFTAVDVTRSVSAASGIPGSTTIVRNSATTIAAASDSVTLPQSTITVASTADFASAGTFFIEQSDGTLQVITYTGKTSTTFTGCTGGTGVIHASQAVGTLSQAVMSAAATANDSSLSVTIGGEKSASVNALNIFGSNNRLINLRGINGYGSFANSKEMFVFMFSTPSGTDGGTSTGAQNNEMIGCVVEQPRGNYGNPYAFFGQSAELPMRHSKAIDCVAYGVNNWTKSGFDSGGVNAGFLQDFEVNSCTFVDCGSLFYCDTGTIDGLRVINSRARRAWDGIGLVADGSGAWTKSDVEIAMNRITIQRRVSGEYRGIRFGGAMTTGANVSRNTVTKLTGGVGGGSDQPWSILVSSAVTNGTCRDNIVDDLNGRFTGTGVIRRGNRQPSGARLTNDTTLADTEGLLSTSTTLGSAANSITVSVPAGYTNLRASIVGRLDGTSSANIGVRFNADTGANYDEIRTLHTSGSSVTTSVDTAITYGIISGNNFVLSSDTANAAGALRIEVPNYSTTTFFKVANFAAGFWAATPSNHSGSVLWHSTAAITSVTFISTANNFVAGTTATVSVE